MKKSNLTPILSALLAAVFVLASCSKSVEYANVIPADASAVVSLDLNALSKKSGLKDNVALMQTLADALQSGLSGEELQYMQKIMNDPSESGLSMSDKVYLFATDGAERQGIVAKVNDPGKLKALFKVLEDEQIAMKLTDAGVNGYQYTFLNEKDFACFNENTLLVLVGMNMFDTESTQEEAMRLIALTAEQSFLSTKGFKQMNAQKDDVAAYMSMDMLPTRYAMLYKDNLPENISPKDIAFTGALNFEKGKIALDLQAVPNDALSKYQEQYKEVISKLGSDFLDYFPASSLIYTGVNINGDKLVDFLSTQEEYKKVLKEIDGSGVDLGKLIGSIDGNLSYALTSVSPQGEPSLICYVKVKNDEILQAVNNSFGDSVQKTGENEYVVRIGIGINVYYGMKDGVLYFTTDKAVAANACKKADHAMNGAKWASTLKSSYGFMVLNIKDALNLPIVNMAMSMGGEEAALLRMVFTQFDYIEFSVPEMNKMTMNILMTNQNENSLKQLVALGEQLAGN